MRRGAVVTKRAGRRADTTASLDRALPPALGVAEPSGGGGGSGGDDDDDGVTGPKFKRVVEMCSTSKSRADSELDHGRCGSIHL